MYVRWFKIEKAMTFIICKLCNAKSIPEIDELSLKILDVIFQHIWPATYIYIKSFSNSFHFIVNDF